MNDSTNPTVTLETNKGNIVIELYADKAPKTVANFLGLENHTILRAMSGVEALELVEQKVLPDLILLDVMMPEMDGPDTLAALRKLPETQTTPIIFLTAKVQPDEVARFRELGALGVISKPFEPMALADEVRQVWETA